MNCMRVLPIFDGMERVGQECMRNPGMRVNGRMVCEEWRGKAYVYGASRGSKSCGRSKVQCAERGSKVKGER